jgi:hypothetical protein
MKGTDLRWWMSHSDNALVKAFATRIQDPASLAAAVEELLCPKQ